MAIGGSLGINQQFSKINFRENELKELQQTYENYKIQFEEIGKLKDGDKLARDTSNVYYRHSKDMYLVQLRRWWLDQGRDFTFTFLDEDFTKFMKYLDKVLSCIDTTFDNRYKQLAKDLKDLANNVMTGLYTLKKTYPEEKELSCKIDSIILSLIDFKNSIGEKLEIVSVVIKRQRALSD